MVVPVGNITDLKYNPPKQIVLTYENDIEIEVKNVLDGATVDFRVFRDVVVLSLGFSFFYYDLELVDYFRRKITKVVVENELNKYTFDLSNEDVLKIEDKETTYSFNSEVRSVMITKKINIIFKSKSNWENIVW